MRENAPIYCWRVEMCLKETTQPEWWNLLWTARSCVCTRDSAWQTGRCQPARDTDNKGHERQGQPSGFLCGVYSAAFEGEEISEKKAFTELPRTAVWQNSGHTIKLQSSLRIMIKGLFAVGHVGFYLLLQNMHWTCKKNNYKPSARHIKEKWPWTSKLPSARAQLWGKAWWPEASSEVSLGTGRAGDICIYVYFALALTRPSCRALCLCLQWNIPVFQAARPWFQGGGDTGVTAFPPVQSHPRLTWGCTAALPHGEAMAPCGDTARWRDCSVTSWNLGLETALILPTGTLSPRTRAGRGDDEMFTSPSLWYPHFPCSLPCWLGLTMMTWKPWWTLMDK